MEYYSEIKRSGVWLHAKPCMYLRGIMLRKRHQSLNGYIMSDVIDKTFWKKTKLGKENRLVAARGWGGGRV